jgi:membrane protease YdiL (CAAX protease family)
MSPARLTLIVAAGEGGMLAAAILAAWATGVRLQAGVWRAGLLWGLLAAAALAAINLALLRYGGDAWPGHSLRHVCRLVVRPLFGQLRLWQIALISLLAGLGEELLFRGVLQPFIGVVAASLVFGAVHVGGRSFVGYGAWAATIGLFFGGLAVWTGGLTAPVVAHAMYDALALAYVRFGPQEPCEHT